MRLLTWCFIFIGLGCAGLGFAQPLPQAQQAALVPAHASPKAIGLSPNARAHSLSGHAVYTIDETGQASAAEILARPNSSWRVLEEGQPSDVAEAGVVWIAFGITNQDPSQRWILVIGRVQTALARLYSPSSPLGQLRAGREVPTQVWPRAARFPSFEIDAAPGQTAVPYLLALKPGGPYSLSLALSPQRILDEAEKLEYLRFGGFFGLVLIALAYALMQALTRRDRAYVCFAFCAVFLAILFGFVTGMAQTHLTDGFARLNQVGLVLAALGVYVSVLILIHHLYPAVTEPRFAGAVHILLVVGGAAAAAAILVVPPNLAWRVFVGYLILLVLESVRRLWMARKLAAKSLTCFCVAGACLLAPALWPALAVMGLAPMPSAGHIAGSIQAGSALFVLLCFQALSVHNAARDVAFGRRSGMLLQDPLTGLLQKPMGVSRLEQLLLRSEQMSLPGGVLLIKLANYRDIAKRHGAQIAERAVVAAAERISREVRAIDAVARSDAAQFMVLMEATFGKEEVADFAERVRRRAAEHADTLPQLVSLELICAYVALPIKGSGTRQAQAEVLLRALEHHLEKMRSGSGRLIMEVTPEMVKEITAVDKLVAIASGSGLEDQSDSEGKSSGPRGDDERARYARMESLVAEELGRAKVRDRAAERAQFGKSDEPTVVDPLEIATRPPERRAQPTKRR